MSDIDQLRAIFPDADPRVLSETLCRFDGNVERAADALLADPPLAAPSAPSGLTTGAAAMAAAGHPRAQPHDYVFGAPPAAESNTVANIIGHGPGRRPEPAVGTPVGVGVPVSVPLVPVGFGFEPSPPEGKPAQQAPSIHAVPDRATRPPPDLGPTPALTVGLPPPRLTGRRKALLVGINYRGTRAELRGCHNDVASLFDLLTQKYGWDRTCVHALVDDGRRGFAGEPTRANIVNGLRWLSQDARPGDVLFFAFSGHGAQQPDPNGFEEDGMNETILPVDFQTAGMITDDEIGSILVRVLPDGVRLTALMDSCHSGTGLDLPYSWEPRFGGWREETNPYHSLGDVQMISGCEDDDVSCDARHYGRAGGAMTTAFCDVLRRYPAPSYHELLREMSRHIAARGMSQRPQLSSSQRIPFDRPFLVDDICSNENPTIGRVFRRKFPPRPRDVSSTPLGTLLGVGAAVYGGMLVGDALGSAMAGESSVIGGMFDSGGGLLDGVFGG